MKVFALIANCPNGIDIPCRFWASNDISGPLADCVAILGTPSDSDESGASWDEEDDEDQDSCRGAENCFTSYYSGCGGVYCLSLAEVPQNESFLSFSLD